MIKNPIDIHIGQKLRKIRVEAKISQEQVGEMVGVSLQQVQKYEIGVNKISASKLYKFAKIFDKPINSFFDDCLTDADLYDIKLKSDINNLINAFSKINDAKIRKDVINLVNSICAIKTQKE